MISIIPHVTLEWNIRQTNCHRIFFFFMYKYDRSEDLLTCTRIIYALTNYFNDHLFSILRILDKVFRDFQRLKFYLGTG